MKKKFRCPSSTLFMFTGVLFILAGTVQAQPDKPNILFISIDDLNDWGGVMNTHPQVQRQMVLGKGAD